MQTIDLTQQDNQNYQTLRQPYQIIRKELANIMTILSTHRPYTERSSIEFMVRYYK